MLRSGSGGQDARSRPGRPALSRSQRHQAKPVAATPGKRWDYPPVSQISQPARSACQQAGCRIACHRTPPVCSLCIVLAVDKSSFTKSSAEARAFTGLNLKQLRSPRGGQSLRLTGIPQRCGADGRPGEGSRDAALRERRAGRPLATGPSGLKSEPKAPGKAWREDARQTLGLSTDIAGIAA